MKLVRTIARYLLGLLLTVFGFNGFLHFIPLPPPSNPLALENMTVMTVTHYFVLIFFIEALSGILLLGNRFVPLALTLLAPVLVNILLFHSLMDPAGALPGAFSSILLVLVYWSVGSSFRGIFQPKPVAE